MESGEKELRKVFEEVTSNNVKACISFGNETRKQVKDVENKITLLESHIKQLEDEIKMLNLHITNLQSIIYKGGT